MEAAETLKVRGQVLRQCMHLAQMENLEDLGVWEAGKEL
jgi:hypothetical protein